MNFKGIVVIIVLTAAFTWSLFTVVQKTKTLPPQEGSSTGSEMQGSQSTDDHHGGVAPAVNSAVFESLVGKPAPDFTLESYNGQKFSLGDLKGKNVVLFFNEGLMCYPACWNQIAAFGQDKKFNNDQTVALNIVNDRKDQWKSAIEKMPELAPAVVIFDTNRVASLAYGVLALPSSMHRGQLAGHSYVIIDRQGTVRFVKDDPQMAVRNEALVAEIAKL